MFSNYVVINSIQAIVDEAAAMKNAYFWAAPRSAKERRAYEAQHSHPEVVWTEGGHTYTAEYCVECSCQNVYAHGVYTKDGVKTTLTAIRNSLKRMRQA